ncbi:A24 family peptidase [Halorussus halophilus]|uniref:A24 family peptidase n=1 Tax=Halorussus halophilus TaxID=2650975 RepID=UPI001CE41531|nr:A24 family peptidase [Halorussus halophilus]
MPAFGFIDASIPDLLRLLAVPILGWASWRDIETRRVPNQTWYPLAILAVVLLFWEGWLAVIGTAFQTRAFGIRTAVSLGFVAPLVIAFWWFRAFGGADAKAFLVVAALFPTFPVYELPTLGLKLPHQTTTLGVFSLTILTNTVLLGALFPLAILLRNVVAGRFSKMMAIGKPVRWDEIPRAHGKLLESEDGLSGNGVDLDAVRMYLRWRGLTLGDLREQTDHFRDPATLPANPNSPGDGAVTRADGGEHKRTNYVPAIDVPENDPWGAEKFLNDIQGSAYGTTPERLRGGLEVLTREERVWVSPGIPFIVPLFFGLVVSLTYGDLLFGLLGLLGLV